MKIVTREQMQELDRRAIAEKGIQESTLIERAGKAAADWIARRYHGETHRVLALVGRGNNGADAVVTSRRLRKMGFEVLVVKAWKKDALAQVEKELCSPGEKSLLVLDGLFGTGLNRPIGEPFRSLVDLVRALAADVVALDLPSGLDADSGKPFGTCIRATHTLTFGLPKIGLVQEHAADDVGELHVLDIGFPSGLVDAIRTSYDLIDPPGVASIFTARARTTHKGKLGHVLIVAGSVGFAGAGALAARAALRAGAGLVSLAVPSSIYDAASSLAGPEVMVHPCNDGGSGFFNLKSISRFKVLQRSASALVIGPGMGQHPDTRLVLEKLIESGHVPMLLDADALNLLAGRTSMLRQAKRDVVITPHPGEMARLSSLTVRAVQQDRSGVASTFSQKHKVTVVLKGARTLVAHRAGHHALRFSINALAGNPGMATAGCGDTLSGIIGALLVRGVGAADAARGGVFLHAKAGDIALSPTGGGIAGDLIEALPHAMALLTRGA